MLRAAKRLLLASWLSVLCTLAGPRAGLAAPQPRLASAWDLREITRDFPHAVETFKQADAVAAAGRLEEAAKLFVAAQQLAPKSPAPPRRLCEVLSELGRRDEAMRACRAALDNGDAPEDYRAMVGAMMSGSALPYSEEFVAAVLMATGLEKRVEHDPAGSAALFDIALRTGDRALMRAKLRDLERLAPNHYDTQRARRIVAGLGPGPLAMAGWALIVLACALTVARAAGRLRRRTRVLGNAAQAAVLALVVLLGGSAHAEEPETKKDLSRFKIDDADPSAKLPTQEEFQKNPLEFGYLVMDLADRAEEAIKRKDYAGATKYYQAVAKLAPQRAIGLAKVCEVHELAGERDKALEACRQAIRIDGVRPEDYERYVRLILSGTGPLPDGLETELLSIIEHVRKAPAGDIAALHIECQLGVRIQDVAALERCTSTLAKLSPADTGLYTYEWALASLRGQTSAAKRALEKVRAAAKATGIKPDGLATMEIVTHQAELKRAGLASLAVACLLALGVLLFFRRRELSAMFARRSAS